MLNGPFSPWPSYTEEEANAISDVLLSNKVNYWTGDECRQFEREFAAFAGCEYAVAVANGTVALDLALKALSIGPGDEVVVTPRTYIASVSCVVNAGAKPVFADVDLDSQNITAENIRAVLTPSTKAIICVHHAGWPCDMDPIMSLAEERSLVVIEDCAQAHGAVYKGRPIGSLGHIGAWSFCQDKIMTTGGEGGMVTTNDQILWSRMWAYKDHGKSWDAVYKRNHPPGYRWLHETFGTNWRMTELQAVIGRIQLKRMTQWHEIRLSNARRIWSVATHMSWLRVAKIPVYNEHAAFRCYMFVVPAELPQDWNRDRVIEAINEEQVPCFVGSCPEVYMEKAFDETGWRPLQRLPVARELGETSLAFLVHPTLAKEEIAKTINALESVDRKIISEKK